MEAAVISVFQVRIFFLAATEKYREAYSAAN